MPVMQVFLLLMVCGNTFLMCKMVGCLVMCVKETYSAMLMTNMTRPEICIQKTTVYV